jgi:hypothetical protein
MPLAKSYSPLSSAEGELPRLTPHASVTAVAAKRAGALGPDEEDAEYEQAGKEESVSATSACPRQGR